MQARELVRLETERDAKLAAWQANLESAQAALVTAADRVEVDHEDSRLAPDLDRSCGRSIFASRLAIYVQLLVDPVLAYVTPTSPPAPPPSPIHCVAEWCA